MNKARYFAIVGLLSGFVLVGCTPQVTEENSNDEVNVNPLSGSEDDVDEIESSSSATEDAQTEFDIKMSNFTYSQKTLTVKAGDTITVTAESTGGTHDFVIDELEARTNTLSTGDSETITFTIPEGMSGQKLSYYCSVGNHRRLGMEGTLIII